MLRLAVVRLLAGQVISATELSDHDSQRVCQQLKATSKEDGDACTAFFTQVIGALSRGHALTEQGQQFLLGCCGDMINATDAPLRVQCEALETLLLISSDKQAADGTVYNSTRCVAESTNQRYADLHLQWRASQLERLSSRDEHMDSDKTRDVQDWVRCCVAAVEGTASCSREAAAMAIARIDQFYTYMSLYATLRLTMLDLCMAIYELLNDDDEDIRMLAATAASRILAVESAVGMVAAVVPPVASQKLLA
ncbi:hypothetical protein LTR53_018375, partial [Teratosphaeriaceae sp. CCFEE 6253]